MKPEEREANRERWRAEIEAWRASGLTLSAWARDHGLSRDALEYWKRRFPMPRRAQRASRPDRPLTLIRIPPDAAAGSAVAPIEMTVGRSGVRVILPAVFDAASLGSLLDVLEARC
jgi:hypothetical protein